MPNDKEAKKTIAPATSDDDVFVSDAIFREREKTNMVSVLRHTNWRISGTDGAAELLGIKPSTLTYRMKVYGIKQSDYT